MLNLRHRYGQNDPLLFLYNVECRKRLQLGVQHGRIGGYVSSSSAVGAIKRSVDNFTFRCKKFRNLLFASLKAYRVKIDTYISPRFKLNLMSPELNCLEPACPIKGSKSFQNLGDLLLSFSAIGKGRLGLFFDQLIQEGDQNQNTKNKK